MRPLLPTLKEKKRYLVYQVLSENDKLEHKDVKNAITKNIKWFVGELGAAKIGLLHLKDWVDHKGIVRVSAKGVKEARAAITLIKEINNTQAYVKTIALSGTLKKARLKLKKMEA